MNAPPDGRPRGQNAAHEPVVGESGWHRRCAPLLLFLDTPRAWGQLATWASDRSMSGRRLRNMLAWLEQEGLAAVSGDGVAPVIGLGAGVWQRRGACGPSSRRNDPSTTLAFENAGIAERR